MHSMGEVSVHGVRRRSCKVKNETGQQYPGPEGFPSLCTSASHTGRKGVTGMATEARDSWAWLLNVKLSFPEAVKTRDGQSAEGETEAKGAAQGHREDQWNRAVCNHADILTQGHGI